MPSINWNSSAPATSVEALNKLGWSLKPDESIEDASLAARLGVVDRYRPLLARMLTMLADDGLLTPASKGWIVVRKPLPSDTRQVGQRLLERYPAMRGEIEMTLRCGESLAEVLHGSADPLQLLFPGGSLSTAEQMYQESPVARAYSLLVAESMAAHMAHLPEGQTLRVLEIGAGTAAPPHSCCHVWRLGAPSMSTPTSRRCSWHVREKSLRNTTS